MYAGNTSKNTEKAIEILDGLSAPDRLGYLAIFFEHFHQGLFHDGNYGGRGEAEARGVKILEPRDCALDNAERVAHALLALYSELEEPMENTLTDLVEPAITRTAGIMAAQSAFYKLRFKEKIDYVAEVFAGFGCGGLLTGIAVSEDELGVGYDQYYATKNMKVQFGYGEYESDPDELPI